MKIEKIIAIAGKPGLYEIILQFIPMMRKNL